MSKRSRSIVPARTLTVLAVIIAAVGFVAPGASGFDGSPGDSSRRSATSRAPSGHRPVRTIVRVARNFEVAPHSLATNEIVRCPARTKLTGGGTSLIGEPSEPGTAPVVYTNGPVGNIVPGESNSWASEVANSSDERFLYRQFAMCARR
jgi:hypothetical protein